MASPKPCSYHEMPGFRVPESPKGMMIWGLHDFDFSRKSGLASVVADLKEIGIVLLIRRHIDLGTLRREQVFTVNPSVNLTRPH